MKPKANRAEAARLQILADHREITALVGTISATADIRELAGCAARLEPLLTRHFKEEEDFDGLHASIRERTPERESQLAELRREHATLLELMRRMCALADGQATRKELHQMGVELMERLRTHEAYETSVFLESMWNDLGVGD